MIGIPKVMIFLAIMISAVLYWASSNVCRYNFALEKKTDILNIVTEEIDPTLGTAKVYIYEELNCNNVNLDWDIDRVVKNLEAISVLIYQELTTDIKGNPNY
tara:strand:- start:475 stop:780 length:306 start_codon:yes stop_codon:yes gene_type:complete